MLNAYQKKSFLLVVSAREVKHLLADLEANPIPGFRLSPEEQPYIVTRYSSPFFQSHQSVTDQDAKCSELQHVRSPSIQKRMDWRQRINQCHHRNLSRISPSKLEVWLAYVTWNRSQRTLLPLSSSGGVHENCIIPKNLKRPFRWTKNQRNDKSLRVQGTVTARFHLQKFSNNSRNCACVLVSVNAIHAVTKFTD